jgi:hypothetical protein
MHDTLSSLVERALAGNRRPLEFYLSNNRRLPGPRANMELAHDVSYLMADAIQRFPDGVHALLHYLTNGNHQTIISNTPAEFVMLCGIIASGTCAATEPDWREETFVLLQRYACSAFWKIREGVAIAYRHLLSADPQATLAQLTHLAMDGNYLQQRAVIAAVAEPPLLYTVNILEAALELQRIVLGQVRRLLTSERRSEDFRILKRTLGYTLSVVTAAAPDKGFALMRECASWNDNDVNWILRENLRKKRLARFSHDTEHLLKMLA